MRRSAPTPTILLRLNDPADFTSRSSRAAELDDAGKPLDFTGGPVPYGGLYVYEERRRAFNPTDDPFMQPYGAFSGGEVATLAVEAVAGQQLAERATSAIGNLERAKAEAAARAEVQSAIADYCAAQPDRAPASLCARILPTAGSHRSTQPRADAGGSAPLT